MTVWILLTLALGAITGTADAPLLRSHAPSSVTRSSAAAEQRVRRAVATLDRIRAARTVIRTVLRDVARVLPPLTGAESPRAPALSC